MDDVREAQCDVWVQVIGLKYMQSMFVVYTSVSLLYKALSLMTSKLSKLIKNWITIKIINPRMVINDSCLQNIVSVMYKKQQKKLESSDVKTPCQLPTPKSIHQK